MEGPLQESFRAAGASDVTVADTTLPAGDAVVVSYGLRMAGAEVVTRVYLVNGDTSSWILVLFAAVAADTSVFDEIADTLRVK